MSLAQKSTFFYRKVEWIEVPQIDVSIPDGAVGGTVDNQVREERTAAIRDFQNPRPRFLISPFVFALHRLRVCGVDQRKGLARIASENCLFKRLQAVIGSRSCMDSDSWSRGAGSSSITDLFEEEAIIGWQRHLILLFKRQQLLFRKRGSQAILVICCAEDLEIRIFFSHSTQQFLKHLNVRDSHVLHHTDKRSILFGARLPADCVDPNSDVSE